MRRSSIVLACALSLALAGCGGSSSASRATANAGPAPTIDLVNASPADLVAAARRAAVQSRQLKATGVSRDASGTTTVTLGFDGVNAVGTLETAGTTVDLSRINGYDFVKGPDKFWRDFLGVSANDQVARLRGKWVAFTTASKTFAKLTRLLDRSAFLASFVVASKQARRSGEARVAGVDCYVVTDTAGTLYLAKADGRLIRAVDAQAGTVTYTYEGVAIPPPPADRDLVLDADLGLT